MSVELNESPINEWRAIDSSRSHIVQRKCRQGTTCFGYGRLSAAKRNLTPEVQEEQVREYWRRHLEPAGVSWGGFFCDAAAQGSHPFAEREQGRMVFDRASRGDHIVVFALDRSFRSAGDGACVIQSLTEREVRFHSLDLPVNLVAVQGKGVAILLRAVAEVARSCASERTLEVNADRRTRELPVSSRAPMGWKLIGIRARASGTKTSSLEFAVDDQERRLVESIYEKRQAGMSIERIAMWLITQREYPNKRKLDNYKAVEWAIAAKELGYPKRTDGKRVVKEWRHGSRGGRGRQGSHPT